MRSEANAARYPISAQCRMSGVPRSTYYWMTEHPETEHVDPIAGDVRAIRRDSRERYGAGKIKAALERKGVTASGMNCAPICGTLFIRIQSPEPYLASLGVPVHDVRVELGPEPFVRAERPFPVFM